MNAEDWITVHLFGMEPIYIRFSTIFIWNELFFSLLFQLNSSQFVSERLEFNQEMKPKQHMFYV